MIIDRGTRAADFRLTASESRTLLTGKSDAMQPIFQGIRRGGKSGAPELHEMASAERGIQS